MRCCVLQHLLDRAEHLDGQRRVRGPINRQAIADTIGASREWVSRVMLDLTRSGLIEPLPDGSVLVLATTCDDDQDDLTLA